MARTSDELVTAVKRTFTVPSNQALLQDSDIMAFASEELLSKMVPMMISLRQDYFLRVERYAITADIDQYAIPYRAIGRSLQDLKICDGTQTRRMSLIQSNDAHLLRLSAIPYSFYFRGDNIVIVPAKSAGQTLSLEFWYFMRPNSLVATTSAAKVVSVLGDEITVDAVTPDMVPGALIDVVQGRQGNALLAYDCEISNVAGTTITLVTGSLTTAIEPNPVPTVTSGDWVSLAQTSPVIQLPDETFEMLVYRTSMRCLEAIGDFDGKRSVAEQLPSLEKDVEKIMAPRIQNEGKKVIQRNSLLRGTRTLYRRGILY